MCKQKNAGGKKGKSGTDNKATVSDANRNVNRVEPTTSESGGGDDSNESQSVPNLSSLDQSCLTESADGNNNNIPVVLAPTVPHTAGIKYVR